VHLRRALQSDTLDEDTRFDLGCRALLEGLAARIAQHSRLRASR
jgi:hypothetical protein